MVNIFTLEEHVRELYTVKNEELILKTLQVYMDLFPFKDAFLVRYSPIGYYAEGVIGITNSELTQIRGLRDDVRSMPNVYNAIIEKRAKHYSSAELLVEISKYPPRTETFSLTIMPISFGSVVIGYIYSSQIMESSRINETILSSLTLYGKLIGNVIFSCIPIEKSEQLSKRELEVMRRVALGEATKEIATMLGISELTVNQYVKTSIKKLGAKNRTHAVTELFRKGIII